jgi:hypothetical protein
MMRERKMDYQAALAHIKSIRWIASPNPGFAHQLLEYEKCLSEKEEVKEEGPPAFSASTL